MTTSHMKHPWLLRLFPKAILWLPSLFALISIIGSFLWSAITIEYLGGVSHLNGGNWLGIAGFGLVMFQAGAGQVVSLMAHEYYTLREGLETRNLLREETAVLLNEMDRNFLTLTVGQKTSAEKLEKKDSINGLES